MLTRHQMFTPLPLNLIAFRRKQVGGKFPPEVKQHATERVLLDKQ